MRKQQWIYNLILITATLVTWSTPKIVQAQEPAATEAPPEPELIIDAGPARDVLSNKTVPFEFYPGELPQEINIEEVLWDFGDGVQATGEKVTHSYRRPGTYKVSLRMATNAGTASEDTTEVRVFEHLIILVADTSAHQEQLLLRQQQAAQENTLLLVLLPKGGGPEVVTEEELTQLLLSAREDIPRAHLIMTWTTGGVGANVLSKFAQQVRPSETATLTNLNIKEKGIVLLSETPFAVLTPTAQAVFDQLQPAYVVLTSPQALELLAAAPTAEEARQEVVNSPLDFRLLGTFSSRTVYDISITNFMSFGISFLVNRGVPINSIILILMLPVIATILAFARQVIGIKAFGLITPAMTAISFLVMGLRYGLIIFAAVLLAGTLTRLVMRKLHLLYLPRMALVLTSISLALLVLLGLGVATDRSGILSFSIFPALILTILAEEFIALQFKSGLRHALTITSWTLLLSTVCYFIVSWELLRTLILSYPELILLAIPVNIALGQWSGLRLTEYFRFRELLRYARQ